MSNKRVSLSDVNIIQNILLLKLFHIHNYISHNPLWKSVNLCSHTRMHLMDKDMVGSMNECAMHMSLRYVTRANSCCSVYQWTRVWMLTVLSLGGAGGGRDLRSPRSQVSGSGVSQRVGSEVRDRDIVTTRQWLETQTGLSFTIDHKLRGCNYLLQNVFSLFWKLRQ